MAKALFEDYLTCPICLDPLQEPVTLGCHHSFCRSCLNNTWDTNPTRTCPVCRRRSSRERVEVNFALRELSLSFSEQKKNPKICSSHPDVPPLFCLDEARAVCPVCEFSLHSQHTVVSGDEAERRLKKQLQIQALKDQRQSYEELEKTYEQLQRHQEEQTVECVSHITEVFSRLQLILKEEEEKALGALRAEQSKQTQNLDLELQKVREEIATLTNSIQDLQKSIDTHSFSSALTQTYKAPAPLPRPQPKEGLLLNQAKVLGNLGYRVCMKMKDHVTYSPVILDPNTTACSLHLSQDLCGVRHGPPRALPVVPERFTNDPTVLGSEGFSSGQHQWDVEVGDLPSWAIGVVKKSVDRRGVIYANFSYGVWCLWHGEGRYDNGCGQIVTATVAPKKIRVKLDYEKGRLSFYDADLLTLLLIHRAAFTETLFPYVSVRPAAGAKTKEIRISGKVPSSLWGLTASMLRTRLAPPVPPRHLKLPSIPNIP